MIGRRPQGNGRGGGRRGGLRRIGAGLIVAGVTAFALGGSPPAFGAGPVRGGSWGFNNRGQLGDGSTTNRLTPVAIVTPNGVTWSQLTGGFAHSIGLTTTGAAYGWGLNNFGEVGDGTHVNRLTPVAVQMPPGVTFTDVSAFEVHSLGRATDGRVWAWGYNMFGQLGDGTNTDRSAPVAVQMPPGISFVDVDAGAIHSVALASNGTAWAWGDNTTGELGNGTTVSTNVPVAVQMPPGVSFVALAAGLNFCVAIDPTGNAWAWGSNGNGQLGDGTNIDRTTPVAVQMPPGIAFTDIATLGDTHAVALASNGTAWAWGNNAQGQLGDGTFTDRTVPVAVQMPPGITFTDVQTGDFHSMGLGSNGTAWAWGRNTSGQIGDGTSTNRNVPVRTSIPAGITVVGIGAGDHHSFGLGQTP